MKYEAFNETNFKFKGQSGFMKGKVRDVYEVGEDKILFVVSDRISAFDHVLPRPIPYKGEILNLIAAKALKLTEDIVPNWLEEVPDPAVSLGKRCKPFPVEMVIRGYLVGHAWREYKSGKRSICGIPLAEGLVENQKFSKPILTPTSKAVDGHDEDLSRDEILESGLVSEKHYKQLEEITHKLFERGSEIADKQGLILVDTKYEFGLYYDEVYLIDEVHTPDSSRYFYAKGYEENFAKGMKQKQLSKEFIREWLMEQGFQGREGDVMPDINDDVVEMVMNRYIELYEKVTAEKFNFSDRTNVISRIENNVNQAIEKYL
ncbi:MAG: phosphoribosylaminoimidazolesuccinocarboxamide synthase [Bacteroidetes bacterium]|jgi:phosphoribosylaminoimidazole-succinocarboxamide synthase|nr:phosphoribosylaminoimidazolesuccinocarboxamide synthase [Bacteroidota bacterium]MBT5527715.1 phosphoribosylaminoimidazolesuccinocarboxamide synthase [Cytophagia bacterium]MBT3799657.1 phosphoribosylaminoimidazolesuccinocarboxamide synthase [Bacteroidota bacterium]MBT3935129.1 phosphoribosylaminoimidazolesuccinocarboxamide synthase [Bacteroidota bacterium]MBT5989442.1 phosphoribosylaminoimidazolesuccinocarboxamide synthase [Bacteroidota bacterium]